MTYKHDPIDILKRLEKSVRQLTIRFSDEQARREALEEFLDAKLIRKETKTEYGWQDKYFYRKNARRKK